MAIHLLYYGIGYADKHGINSNCGDNKDDNDK